MAPLSRGRAALKKWGAEGRGSPRCVVSLGAQVHRQAFIFAQVGLGKNAAKALFLPEECACPGLTGLPKNGRQRVSYIGLVRNRNNPPLHRHSSRRKLGFSLSPWPGPKAGVWIYLLFGLIWNNSPSLPHPLTSPCTLQNRGPQHY